MKLAAQYTRASMLVTVIVLLIAAGVYYFAISYITDRQFDRDLTEEFAEMNGFVQQHQRFPKPFEFDSYQAKFIPIPQDVPARFVDTMITGPNKTEAARAVVATIQLKGQHYRMTIVESKETTEDLVQLITIITSVLTLVLLVALFLTNRILLRGLWQPFYNLLERLSNFSMTGQQSRGDEITKIDEFQKMQTVITLMEQRTAAEYETLKGFTENASHEMMTPVTVITSKLDNLIQDERLNEEQLIQLQDIYNAGSKLSRLGQSLLLLVKIDQQLIRDDQPLQLDALLKAKAAEFSELISDEQIGLTLDLLPMSVNASPYLVDILINNLLGNAVRHNYKQGTIKVTLDEKQLVIANTGQTAELDGSKIFERFHKGPVSDGTGLGLTIARNICTGYGWQLDYGFQSGQHLFTISF